MSEPTLEDLFRRMIADEQGTQIAGGIPAKVITYDAAKQLCDAQPLAKVATDGSGELHQLPICRSVPVRWPSGAGWAITGPMAAGDIVVLRPAAADIAQWVHQGTENADGTVPRRGALSDVIADPGLRPATSPLTSSQYSAAGLVIACASVLLGDSTASDFVALASLVKAEIEAAITGHVHPAGTLLDSTSAPCTGATGQVATYTASSPAATKVKAK